MTYLGYGIKQQQPFIILGPGLNTTHQLHLIAQYGPPTLIEFNSTELPYRIAMSNNTDKPTIIGWNSKHAQQPQRQQKRRQPRKEWRHIDVFVANGTELETDIYVPFGGMKVPKVLERVPFDLLIRFSKTAQIGWPKTCRDRLRARYDARKQEADTKKPESADLGTASMSAKSAITDTCGRLEGLQVSTTDSKPAESIPEIQPSVSLIKPKPEHGSLIRICGNDDPDLDLVLLFLPVSVLPGPEAFNVIKTWMYDCQRVNDLLPLSMPSHDHDLGLMISVYAASIMLRLVREPRELREAIFDYINKNVLLTNDIKTIWERLPSDSPIIKRMITRYLQNLDRKLITAGQDQEALDYARKQPDLWDLFEDKVRFRRDIRGRIGGHGRRDNQKARETPKPRAGEEGTERSSHYKQPAEVPHDPATVLKSRPATVWDIPVEQQPPSVRSRLD